MSFESFNLHPGLMAGVRSAGYEEPTPIQRDVIPQVLQGRDVIGLAQTGTGKTAAFVLPVLQRLLSLPRRKTGALVVTPTRELAEQTCEVVDELGGTTGIRSIAVYGGTGMEPQVRRLRSGVELVVACPGRLLDHLWKGNVVLSNLEMLVIDEADRMFDMGFLPDIKNILKCLTKPRQTLLFSATMPNDIKKLAHAILSNPVTVQIGHAVPVESVSHSLYPVKQHQKTPLLIEYLKRADTGSVLVFTRTKHRAESVAGDLRKAGFRVASLHGNLTQGRRQAAMEAFRRGSVKILVATDIAARGIDILSISHVINYDMPTTTDAYTHRIGRTGRVDQKGDALTFVTSADSELVRDIENLIKAPLERRRLEHFDYNQPKPVGAASGSFYRGKQAGITRRPMVAGRRG